MTGGTQIQLPPCLLVQGHTHTFASDTLWLDQLGLVVAMPPPAIVSFLPVVCVWPFRHEAARASVLNLCVCLCPFVVYVLSARQLLPKSWR